MHRCRPNRRRDKDERAGPGGLQPPTTRAEVRRTGQESGEGKKRHAECFSCSTDPNDYTNGSYTDSFTNDAYLVTDDQNLDAHAEVSITCHLPALQVTKAAQGEWDRTVTWTLEKSVVESSYAGFPGDRFTPTWAVVLTKIVSGPKNWKISGEIKVFNPAGVVQTFAVEDTLDDGTPVTVSCPIYTVEAGDMVTCTYEAFPDDASATLNTAVVSAVGNADVTATADVPWEENLTGSDSGDLTDPRFDYDETVSASTSVDFDETFTCSADPSKYTLSNFASSRLPC